MPVKTLDEHIEITPDVCFGKPRIAGRRITVHDIVAWHLHGHQPLDKIAADHDLNLADLHAALAYYYDHRKEIDRKLEDDERVSNALRRPAGG